MLTDFQIQEGYQFEYYRGDISHTAHYFYIINRKIDNTIWFTVLPGKYNTRAKNNENAITSVKDFIDMLDMHQIHFTKLPSISITI